MFGTSEDVLPFARLAAGESQRAFGSGQARTLLASRRSDETASARTWHRAESWLLIAVFTVAAGWAGRQMTVGWDHTISGPYQHGFRQAQTALSAVRIRQGGPILDYETPVVGPPWSIPFEFPLYQWMVAATSRMLQLGIVASGRLVGILCFWVMLGLCWALLGELGVKPVHRLVFLTLVVASPLYIFWSRCFMIESTALVLAVAQLYAFTRAFRTGGIAAWALCATLGVLAAVVKCTTWAAFRALVTAMIVGRGIAAVRCGGLRGSLAGTSGALLFAVVVPLAALALWTAHTDHVKSANAIGAGLRSTSPAISSMVFPSLGAFTTFRFWAIVLPRTVRDLTGRLPGFVLPLLGLVVTRRRWKQYAASLALFCIPLALFPDLYAVHRYYAYANGVFLLAAGGWAIEALLEARSAHRALGYALLVACTAMAIVGYAHPGTAIDFSTYTVGGLVAPRFAGYATEQETDDRAMARLGEIVAASTSADRVVVGLGMDWSGELPFYAERDGLMIPNWAPRSIDDPMIRGALDRLRPDEVGALVVCPTGSRDRAFAALVAERLGLDRTPRPAEWCELFTPNGGSKAAARGPAATQAFPH